MMVSAALAALIAAASSPQPAVVDLGDGRYRVTIVNRGNSVQAATAGQLRLNQITRRHCRGRGEVASEGLVVDSGPRRGHLTVSETFSCRSR